MRGLAAIRPAQAPRLRRWDAVILGGALPGLVAGVRLAQRGVRVLVIEETCAAKGFFGLREPFLLPDAGPDGVVGTCLRELGVPLIDRRRLVPSDVALQIATPGARIDFGHPEITLAELTSWGIVEPRAGRDLLAALDDAAREERDALLGSPIVKGPRRRWRGDTPGRPEGSLPEIPDRLRPVLDGLARALSDLGESQPSPPACLRLLGSALSGGAGLEDESAGLRDMLRRRLRELLGEFRQTGGSLSLLSVGGNPAVGLEDPSETCCGRVLILNAPLAGIASACGESAPAPLCDSRPTARRHRLRYRGAAAALPVGMFERVAHLSPPDASGSRAVVTLRAFRCSQPDGGVELIATTVAPIDPASRGAAEEWIHRTVRELLPFSEHDLEAVEVPEPTWDGDDLLSDPAGGRGWPKLADIRLAQRPSIFALERSTTAGLGAEGDLLLGWRGGDAIADVLG